ncbi:MAG: hypothetical protein QG630_199, partial [Patescibacteria group bacterium]|nr:hypothetical protein [Patescibacteria group bacterium]
MLSYLYMKITKNIIIFYHEHCLDGFTSAYVANKKFKDKAEYIPLSHNDSGDDFLKDKKIKISDLKDKEIYFIDFCLNEKELKKVEKIAKKLVVIDHHIGKKELIESLPNHLFRNGVSGGYLAHEYFFPKNKMPEFVKYVSIGDTWTFSKNENIKKLEKNIISYLVTLEFDFKVFAKTEKDFEDKKKFEEIKNLGNILNINYLKLVEIQTEKSKLIDFEGYKIYAINASSIFRNELGHRLALKSKSLFSLIYTFEDGELKMSL